MKLIVFSIVINEEKTIAQVLDLIPKKISGISKIEKFILDDGSTDKTTEIARKHGAEFFSNHAQKRLSYSFQKAVRIALDKGADVVVNIDGDMQFNPKQIPELVAPIVSGEADFVAADRFTDSKTGKRRRPENMPAAKYLANLVGAKIVGRLSGVKFNDVTCGFRAYNRKALLALNINSPYTYTQESFQTLASKKMNIRSIPVEVKYFPDRKSRVVTSFLGFLLNSAINIMKAFRDYEPLTFFGLLGFIAFALGMVGVVFTGLHWLNTGAFSPYISVGLVGLYFVSLGIFIWGLGLVADMLDRLNNNQEKILELTKEIRYPENKNNHTGASKRNNH